MITQALLLVEEDKEDNWPIELLQLRDKFMCNVKQEIQEMKKTHSAELARLKDEHESNVARILEQHQTELAILKIQNLNDNQEICVRSPENNIIEER